MSGQVRADNTNDLLIRILRMGAEKGPAVLVLEDAHWFDSASWALALRVAASMPGLLMVVTSRGPDESGFPGDYARLLQIPGAVRLPLGPLGPEDAVALAARKLGVDALPGRVADLIRSKAQGNPFFSEELAFALRDSGWLVIEGDRCHLAPGVDLDAASIPDRVEGVVNGRVDRLAPAEQLALKVASVIGRLFAVKLLREVYPIEPERDRLPGHLDSLARLELITAEEPEPDLAYLFRHVVTREVVYDRMPFAQRRQIHQAVAEWYERSPDHEPASTYPRLAYHWGRRRGRLPGHRGVGEGGRPGTHRRGLSGGGGVPDRGPGSPRPPRARAEPSRRARWEFQLGEAPPRARPARAQPGPLRSGARPVGPAAPRPGRALDRAGLPRGPDAQAAGPGGTRGAVLGRGGVRPSARLGHSGTGRPARLLRPGPDHRGLCRDPLAQPGRGGGPVPGAGPEPGRHVHRRRPGPDPPTGRGPRPEGLRGRQPPGLPGHPRLGPTIDRDVLLGDRPMGPGAGQPGRGRRTVPEARRLAAVGGILGRAGPPGRLPGPASTRPNAGSARWGRKPVDETTARRSPGAGTACR